MKKFLLLSAATALCCIAITSCSKKSDSTTKPTGPNSFDYIVNNVQDVSIEQNSSAAAAWEISLSKGTQESVKLAISGLPPDVTATPSTTEGIPTYSSAVLFNATAAAVAGTYPITITGTSASTNAKTYKFNLVVKPTTDCAAILVGSYTTTDTCSNYNGSYTTNITKGAAANSIAIENFANYAAFNGGAKINATLDCATNTITIPSQTTSSYTFSGSGTFTTNSLRINYTVSYYVNGSPVVSNCVSVFTK